LHKCTEDEEFGVNTELAVIPHLSQRACDSRGKANTLYYLGCRRTFPQDRIQVPAERDCQVVSGKHGPLIFQMILEYHHALTGMPPFIVAMEEGRCGL